MLAAILTIAKTWKQAEWPSTDRWVKVHIYTVESYSAIQNEVMPSAATRIQLEMVTLSEVRDGDFPDSPAANSAPISVSAAKKKSCVCNTTETHLRDRISHRTDWWLRGRGCWERGGAGGWGQQMEVFIFRIENVLLYGTSISYDEP